MSHGHELAPMLGLLPPPIGYRMRVSVRGGIVVAGKSGRWRVGCRGMR